jgi:SnoaL-like domain
MLAVESPLAAYRAAAEAQDTAAMLACLRPDVVLTSPITHRFTFNGHAQLGPLLDDVHAVLSDARFRVDTGDDRARLLVLDARVGRERVTELLYVTLDDEGLIATMELALRPMPGLLAMAAALGPRVARRRGRARALAVRAMIAPMVFAATRGEGVASRLAAP